jgi:hypothetical protein
MRVPFTAAPSNTLEDLLPRNPGALAAIMHARARDVVRVDADEQS